MTPPETAGTPELSGELRALARAVLKLADDGGMPDSYWATDSRVTLARNVLGVPADGRYTHDHLWADL